ncbi:MAG TPA: SpoIIE family protein phosphatase [Verrucomicrobiae bacterium]|nr:SpoIIE family protein phosphatase [Verrucomicrobiae bacterium]
MKPAEGIGWRGLGGVEKVFLVLIVLFAVLYFTGKLPALQLWVALAAFFFGLVSFFRLLRSVTRNMIWRLRNRLIVAYLFIAVVPVVLMLALLLGTSYAVVGQTAVYLVNTELKNRMRTLNIPAFAMSRVPSRDAQTALARYEEILKDRFPGFEILSTGENPFRYPANSVLESPPEPWKNTIGLVTKERGADKHLFAWAHAEQGVNEVTIMAPVTHELMTSLVPGLGEVNFLDFPTPAHESLLPPAVSTFDLHVRWPYPVYVASFEAPNTPAKPYLMVVDTRYSAVLGIVFGQTGNWSELAMSLLIALVGLFLIVEIISLWAGIKLTRTITGAVHELYEGTRHVREADFSYRIPVKGTDQLAELSNSFNTMTQNLGRLIVVAKEKERLESELTIAREVQNQLFPKNAPAIKTLELKGVCNPARMVSGDYYDFMPLPGGEVAFAIGDVAGKGISAALLMASIQSTMRTQLSALNGHDARPFSVASMVATLNRQLYATTSPEKYATFYFALYDEATHTLTYTNAGHLAPILVHGSGIQMLESTGTVVGAFPIARYEEKSVSLEPGDLVLAYTDGITEPENVYGEMFGEERLKELAVKYAKADSAELIAHTMEAVTEWTGSGELQDDMTMVVARRI